MLFAGIGVAVATAEDLQQGFIDRLRPLPILRSSVLVARAIADTAILTLASAVTVGIAFAVGFRLRGSAVDGLAAFGLVVAFGFAFEWLFVTMGLLAGNAQAAQGVGMIVFPFVFISSAYIPISTMAGRLQAFAKDQPLTPMVDSVRALTLGPRPPVTGALHVVLRPPRTDLDGRDHRRLAADRCRQIPARIVGNVCPSPAIGPRAVWIVGVTTPRRRSVGASVAFRPAAVVTDRVAVSS